MGTYLNPGKAAFEEAVNSEIGSGRRWQPI